MEDQKDTRFFELHRKTAGGALYEVHRVDENTVDLIPAGGGFVRQLDQATFALQFEPVTAPLPYRAVMAGIEGAGVYPAYTTDYRWNGWTIPMVEKRVGLHIAADMVFAEGKPFLSFDEARGAFVYSYWDHQEDGKPVEQDLIEAEQISVGEAVLEVFNFGLGWCWREMAPEGAAESRAAEQVQENTGDLAEFGLSGLPGHNVTEAASCGCGEGFGMELKELSLLLQQALEAGSRALDPDFDENSCTDGTDSEAGRQAYMLRALLDVYCRLPKADITKLLERLQIEAF